MNSQGHESSTADWRECREYKHEAPARAVIAKTWLAQGRAACKSGVLFTPPGVLVLFGVRVRYERPC